MKTQRRQQLQTNELADSLGTFIQRITPYGNWIVGGVVLVVVVIFATQYYLGQQQVKNEQAWNKFFQAIAERELQGGGQEMSPTRVREVATKYPGTVASLWAELRVADMKLRNGIAYMFPDRTRSADPEEGRNELDKAQTGYETVLEQARQLDRIKGQPLIIKATWGLGQVYETRASASDISRAIEKYQEIKTKWPGDGYALLANRRIESLEQDQELARLDIEMKRDGDKRDSFFSWFEDETAKQAANRSTPREDLTDFNNDDPLDNVVNKVVPRDSTPPPDPTPLNQSKTKPDKTPESPGKKDPDADKAPAKDGQDPPAKKPAGDQEGTPPIPPKP